MKCTYYDVIGGDHFVTLQIRNYEAAVCPVTLQHLSIVTSEPEHVSVIS